MEGGWARVPVMGQWQPRQRRLASLGSTVAAAALLGFAVLAVLIGGAQADVFLAVLLVLLIAMFVFQALVVVTGLKQQSLAAGAQGWEQGLAPPQGAQAQPQQLTLRCSSCGTVFDVQDTGERPLRHVCPGCGAEGQLTEQDIGPGSVPSETAAMAPPAEPITLKCGSCGTVFDVQDTGERPLRHVCPGCGAEGELREEDLGPAPAPAPAAPAPAPEEPRPKPTRTVKTLKLRCKSCSTVFTLRDTGERPLYHECPGCKATGVLR